MLLKEIIEMKVGTKTTIEMNKMRILIKIIISMAIINLLKLIPLKIIITKTTKETIIDNLTSNSNSLTENLII